MTLSSTHIIKSWRPLLQPAKAMIVTALAITDRDLPMDLSAPNAFLEANRYSSMPSLGFHPRRSYTTTRKCILHTFVITLLATAIRPIYVKGEPRRWTVGKLSASPNSAFHNTQIFCHQRNKGRNRRNSSILVSLFNPKKKQPFQQLGYKNNNDDNFNVFSILKAPLSSDVYKNNIDADIYFQNDNQDFKQIRKAEYSGDSQHNNREWNDSNERRKRRLESLKQINRDTIHHPISKNKSSATVRYNNPSNHDSRGKQTGGSPAALNSQLNLPYDDMSQLHAIKSNAPAILLPSGPGTGKSHVLSLRIAYTLQKYLQRKQQKHLRGVNQYDDDRVNSLDDCGEEIEVGCSPDSMVILSFTNRDAQRLKERALDYLFPISENNDNFATQLWRNQTSQQLWSGTMHAFSLAILQKYGSCPNPESSACSSKSFGPPLRVLPAREMRNRVSASLKRLLGEQIETNTSNSAFINSEQWRKGLRSRHLQALNDVGHSSSSLLQNIVRCIDLWKEANLPLTPPVSPLVYSLGARTNARSHNEIAKEHDNNDWFVEQQKEHDERETHVKRDCVELAMRLGIPQSSALLALDVFPEYQARHAAAGTADPSDLAGMAYRLLLTRPMALNLIRSKLNHIIVDEYQDMSVSQHALLRIIVRGVVEEDDVMNRYDIMDVVMGGYHSIKAKREKLLKEERQRHKKLPILLDQHISDRRFATRKKPSIRSGRKLKKHSRKSPQNYNVPILFCAGDASQSIYGWRGAAPSLTVDGFRRDYPQGIVAPLHKSYRLPNDILDAASMLLPAELQEGDDLLNFWGDDSDLESSDVSPAAAAKVANSLRKLSSLKMIDDSVQNIDANEDDFDIGQSILLSESTQDSSVLIHGLWDEREEAKYIATTIRRRSKQRRKSLIRALKNVDSEVTASENYLRDLTDVAVMVRSANQLELVKEALKNAGIPFVLNMNNDRVNDVDDSPSWLDRRDKSILILPMKPVTLMTMHRSKGEEFDDVYLANWSEGSFPHPDAVSSNRVHEERRLAYVALTRARQRVVITHSFISRILHFGKDRKKKYVTSQRSPSRFLYELMPSKRVEDGVLTEDTDTELSWLRTIENEGTVWNRDLGYKEIVAGQNLPDFFQKSYREPTGFRQNILGARTINQHLSKRSIGESDQSSSGAEPTNSPGKSVASSYEDCLEIAREGLASIIIHRENGASKRYTPIFKEMLSHVFKIHRGNALILSSSASNNQSQDASVDLLTKALPEELERKPLSKCTATQLGHFLAYMALTTGVSKQH